MKNTLVFSVVAASLFLARAGYAMAISADDIQSVQVYSGQAQVVFKPGEAFDITSARVPKGDEATLFSGSVVVVFQGGELKADSVTVKKQADGGSLLQAREFILKPSAAG